MDIRKLADKLDLNKVSIDASGNVVIDDESLAQALAELGAEVETRGIENRSGCNMKQCGGLQAER